MSASNAENDAAPSHYPPPYALSETGFPPGYFVIRNLATGKLLDVERDERHDGAEVILFPETEFSRVLSFRNPASDNQVFFVDYLGTLCCKSSGHGLDVESDGSIVMRHRRPVSLPFPNSHSHPLPQFHYEPRSGQISVHFSFNPAYPGPNQSTRNSWQNRTYLLTSVPSRRPRGLMDDASDFLQGAAAAISTPFASVLGMSGTPAPQTTVDDTGDIDLREDELSEVDRGEEELDDHPEPIRRVRVISLPYGAPQNVGPNTKARRQWEVIPLLKSKAMTGAM